MNILIVAPFCSLPGEPHFNRFQHLAELLSVNHRVTLVTSRFRHYDKSQREIVNCMGKYRIVLIDEPGYRANVSVARIRSHATFARNFRAWFTKELLSNYYEVVYSAFPLISTNVFLGQHKHEHDYRLLIDIQDVWPEAISAAIPLLARCPPRLTPLSRQADAAYRSADGLVAVSRSYLARASSINLAAPSRVVYIGANSARIRDVTPRILTPGQAHFAYIGSLSHSYDMETVVRGFNALAGESVTLHVIGSGPDIGSLRKLAGANVLFYGFVHYDDMIAIAKGCQVLINPVKANSRASITNKLSDYLFLGKPIINCQRHPEVLEILGKTACVHYASGDVASFVGAVRQTLKIQPEQDPESLAAFDREIIYPSLVRFIEGFANL
jgi:hypothetical protein